MKKEHQRLLNTAKYAKDSTLIKASDSILVLVANKEGLWVMNGNFIDNVAAMAFMENIISELRKP